MKNHTGFPSQKRGTNMMPGRIVVLSGVVTWHDTVCVTNVLINMALTLQQ